MTLETVCAWHAPRPVLCRDGEVLQGPVPEGPLSHGICSACRVQVMNEPEDPCLDIEGPDGLTGRERSMAQMRALGSIFAEDNDPDGDFLRPE